MADIVSSGRIGLRVADLELWLDARRSGVRMALPAGHAGFMAAGALKNGLTLCVRDGLPRSTEGWESLFYDAGTWQLWRDGAGRYVFVSPRDSPPRRQIAVDPAFTEGEVVGEFGANGAMTRRDVYPLQHMDMAIFSNWLAETGDLIVHAAGVDDGGQGYAFVGPSGSGKSTLADCLSASSPVTVLGEDQVIVRWREGRFLLYGTPWHSNPARCSPGGVPLVKLFFLDRASGHCAEPCGCRIGIERLLQDAIIPYYNRAGVERILDALSRLAEQVPFHTLSYQLGADVLKLIREV